jgi:hypothetical protein
VEVNDDDVVAAVVAVVRISFEYCGWGALGCRNSKNV